MIIEPAIIFLKNNKIKGKTKKGLLIYKAIGLKTNNKYYVPTSVKSKENIYGLIKYIPDNKLATLDILFDINNHFKAEELALLYKYDLYVKPIFTTNNPIIKFNNNPIIKHNNNPIISIDPPGCIDIDDAFSLDIENNCINIYIASIIDYTQEDYLTAQTNLFSIYNKYNKNIHMINTTQMMNMSLIKNIEKSAIEIKYNYKTKEYSWSIVRIIIEDNLSYENIPTKYKELINNMYKYLEILPDIHKLIEILMLMVNKYIGSLLYKLGTGIMRIQKENKPAEYIIKSNESFMHFGLKTENYCHFSSPIRRFADVYNHYILYGYKYLKLEKSMDEQNRDLILIEKLIENLNYKNMQIKKYNWNMNLIELYDIINTKYGGYYVSNNFKVLYIYSNFYIVNLIDFDIKININNTNNIKDAYIEIATITTKNYILDRLQINIKT